MKIFLTEHVRFRMRERNIRLADIQKVITSPMFEEPIFDYKIKMQGMIGKQTLEIIIAKEYTRIIVITAYFL